MKKNSFFYLKNTLILSFLLFLFLSIPPVFASQLNQSLTYDGNGNLITGDGKYREYNEFNQLIRVYEGNSTSGTILESYLYHPTEDRILIKYGDYSSSTPDDAVVYVNENLEKSYTNLLRGTLRVNYTYYVFDESGLVGELVKNNTNATLRILYYHNYYSGSVSLITNSSGSVVEETFYEPFGGILQGGEISRYSYEGKEFSSVTDDFDFHFRKYNPRLMIFTQPDSVVVNVYDPQTLNRYAFEKNNPYKYVDEDGKIIDTIADVGFIIYDISQLTTKEGRSDWVNWVSLGADVAGALVPFATGLGAGVKAGVKGIEALDKIGDVEKIGTFGKTGEVSEDAAKILNEYGNKIMSYKDASSLTKGLGGELQAHHLVESRFLTGESKLNSPSIILTKEQHNVITRELRKELPYGSSHELPAIKNSYNKVYSDSKSILKSISKFLGGLFK